jgi:FKBP-type peptidyl-prolyl cis-trans isomerase
MRSHKLLISLCLLAILALIMSSCNTDGYKGYKQTGSGIYYKVDTKDNTDTMRVAVGKIITLEMKYYLDDTVLFDSRGRAGEMRFPVQESRYEGDFYEALQLFNQGDSGTFILRAGPFFTQTIGQPALPDYVTEDEDVYFDFFVQSVMTQQEMEEVEAERAEQAMIEEPGKIAKFVEEKGITVEPDEDGIYYIEKVKGKGRSADSGDFVTLHFNVFLVGGDRLFASSEAGDPLDFQMGARFENDGFQEVVQRMKPGGKSDALVPSSKAFGKAGMGVVVPPYSALFYEIDLISVMSQEEHDKQQAEKAAQQKAENAMREQRESADLQKYLEDNNITTPALESGLIYIEEVAGSGAQPATGQRVKVHYTGRLLDGTKFDSSVDKGQPFEFTLGQGQVIRGWDQGIALMKEGGKATLIIPSKIGYGERGAGGMIPPFSTLVFDVELIEIVK